MIKKGWWIFIQVSTRIPVFAESRSQAKKDAKDFIRNALGESQYDIRYRIEKGVISEPIQATEEDE